MISPRRIFLHYHNREILGLYGGYKRSETELLQKTLLLTRYSLLLSDARLVILPKYLFEVPYFRRYLNAISPVLTAGLMQYTSDAPDWGTDVDDKRIQYRSQQTLFPAYFDPSLSDHLLRQFERMEWTPKLGSATKEIEIGRAHV